MSDKTIITILLLSVAVIAFGIGSCFSASLDRHVFCAGVTFDAVGVSTQGVVGSTETIRGER